jgi:hypothetical protein
MLVWGALHVPAKETVGTALGTAKQRQGAEGRPAPHSQLSNPDTLSDVGGSHHQPSHTQPQACWEEMCHQSTRGHRGDHKGKEVHDGLCPHSTQEPQWPWALNSSFADHLN